jgi:hypothetical protein
MITIDVFEANDIPVLYKEPKKMVFEHASPLFRFLGPRFHSERAERFIIRGNTMKLRFRDQTIASTGTASKKRRFPMIPVFFGLSAAFIVGCLEPSGPADAGREKEEFGIINGNDYFTASGGGGLAKSALAFGPDYKWHHYNILRAQQNGELRWFLQTNCNDGFDARNVIRQAYAKWQSLVPFTFVEVSQAAQANTVIRFVSGPAYTNSNNTTTPWWGNANSVTLGVGWAPHETLQGLGYDFWGDIEINDLAQWNQGTTPSVVVTGRPGGGSATFASSLLETLTHEIGHTLGLNHDDSHALNIMHSGGNSQGTGKLWDADILTAAGLYEMGYEASYGYERSHNLVTAGYQKIYGRNPDAGGLQYYRTALTLHGLPSKNGFDYRTFLSDLGSSDEAFYTRSGGVPSQYIVNLYSWFLNRVPSSGEVNAWLNYYATATRRQVAEGFVYSPEWNIIYVSDLYTRMLGRQPDQNGLNYFTGLLNTRTTSPLSLDVAFANSGEFYSVSSPANATGNITRVYQTMLGRTPAASEVNAWRVWLD